MKLQYQFLRGYVRMRGVVTPASSSVLTLAYVCACGALPATELYQKIETDSNTISSFKTTMFAELNFAKTINRFKANKGVKPQRVMKYAYEKHWKAQKNRAMQVQSRAESEFDEDTLQPEKHLTRWEQHYQQHRLKVMFPLGAGW